MSTTKKTVKAWGLVHNDTFIAALRFRPKRVYQGKKGEGYYAWTDVNGAKYHDKKDFPYASNVLEGSMNAKCIPMTVTYLLSTKK